MSRAHHLEHFDFAEQQLIVMVYGLVSIWFGVQLSCFGNTARLKTSPSAQNRITIAIPKFAVDKMRPSSR